MSRQVCSACLEDFRASSIFVERPYLTHCPYCGVQLEPVIESSVDQALLDPGHEPTPPAHSPVHRAA